MKPTYARRYRRSTATTRESAISRKDNQQEHAFFAAPSNQSFFKPNVAIQRTCDHCETAGKQVNRMGASKEEEMIHKKEEDKELHRLAESKEEEKKIQKTDDKKEEQVIHRMEDKKEEKAIQKVEDKKDEHVHRMEDKKEELKVAKKSTGPESVDNHTNNYVQSIDGRGNVLPDQTAQFFTSRMGHDMSTVKIHVGTQAQESAKALNAKAYAVGNNIVFNKGQYNPGTAEGDKLLAHELTHVVQNKKVPQVSTKALSPDKEKETAVTISGSGTNSKSKKAFGKCENVQVDGLTEFKTLPSSFSTKGKTKPSDLCEACTPPDCIDSHGVITSKFKSDIKITLPAVPSGLTKCETAAVKKFIKTTLKPHEQQHKAAFKTYNGTVKTTYDYTGCKSGLQAYVQTIHNDLDTQRSTDAIAASDALDPFVRTIPCDCD